MEEKPSNGSTAGNSVGGSTTTSSSTTTTPTTPATTAVAKKPVYMKIWDIVKNNKRRVFFAGSFFLVN